MNIGDLIKWRDSSSRHLVEKVGILLGVLDDRGHYSVLKILSPDGNIVIIKYLSELPEIINEYSE